MEKANFKISFRGYNKQEVDDFLAKISTVEVSAREIYDQLFSISFKGYDKNQVDLYLDQLINKLKAGESLIKQTNNSSSENSFQGNNSQKWDDGIRQ